MMSKLFEKLNKNAIVKGQILEQSKYFQPDFIEERIIPTKIPMLNLALYGSTKRGGIVPGITMIAAPPKHFKTSLSLQLVITGQQHFESLKKEHLTVIYDSELGATLDYYKKSGVDISKVSHKFITSIEELTADLANLVNDIEEGDNVMIYIGSLGGIPSTKEIEDALSGEDKVDMTRAKKIKGMFRIITPNVVKKQIYVFVENHSYQTLERYSREIASGGRGAQFAAHTLLFITKAKETDAENESIGHRFTLVVGLSRYVREGSKFPITALYGEGILKYSGIFDLGLELGFIEKLTSSTKYTFKEDKLANNENHFRKRKDMEFSEEYMERLLNNREFTDALEKAYAI